MTLPDMDEPVDALVERIHRGDDISDDEFLSVLKTADRAGMYYYSLLTMVRDQKHLARLPAMLKDVIKTEAWRSWRWVGSEFRAESLGHYLTTPPPNGLGIDLHSVEKLISDDPEALALFREATTAKKGRPSEKSDNVTIKAERGNRRNYTLDRLKRERPDLFAQVAAGECSANQAAIAAGFRKPPDPLHRLRAAWKQASAEQRAQFLTEIGD